MLASIATIFAVILLMASSVLGLLDDLDKELNNYNMRCREWYGWHFPELTKIVTDNLVYVRTIQAIGQLLSNNIYNFTTKPFNDSGMRQNISSADLSDILPEEVEEEVREAAEISMGTEVW